MKPFLRNLKPHWRALCAALLLSAGNAQAQTGWEAVTDGSIVLFRHANAPGVGDPDNFRLNDCSTQRNLDALGRAQSRQIGAQFRQRSIAVGQVLTSQWCRTRETAQLAFPGMPVDAPAFNSFFANRNSGELQTKQALHKLTRWRGPGVLVVVTHQVNIAALTQISPSSAEGIVVRPKGQGLEVLGSVRLE
jgi:phosphohistidine phosphatase SixA